MSANLSQRMSAAEFLEWSLRQEERYELVDGIPVPLHETWAMTGARISHDRVVVNLIAAVRNRLRQGDSPCDVFTADIAVLVPGGTVRRPDLAVYCPPLDLEAAALEHPRLIFEVMSVSTQSIDQFVKLREYQTISSLDYIVFVEPLVRAVMVWSRDVDGAWQHGILRNESDIAELPRLDLSLPLADIYERVSVQEPKRPRLVWTDEP